MESLPIFKERADRVLADTFCGLHNVPGKIKPWGYGIAVNVSTPLSTYDFNQLTRLVLSAHKHCIRVTVSANMRYLRIELHERQRDGNMYERHPTIEQAIAQFEKNPERQSCPPMTSNDI